MDAESVRNSDCAVKTERDDKLSNSHRDSNIELFRILTMLLIIAHHYVVNSGVAEQIISNPYSVNSYFLLIFGMWGKIGINCFIMITGYFMCTNKITAKKFVKLVFEWLFYKYVILTIFYITGYQEYTLISLLKESIPITTIDKNFVTCFLIFYLLIPFLNILIKNMSKRQHFLLVLLLVSVYSIYGAFQVVVFNYVTWFCILYIIASYIRLYPRKWMNRIKLCCVGFVISCAVSVSSVMICYTYTFVMDANTFLAVVTAVFAFLLFKNIKIPYNKAINTMAASTFGVLLIHTNSDSMRQWLWKDVVNCVGHFGDKWMPCYAIICVLGIFIVCITIDIVRIITIERPVMRMIK